MPSPFPDIDIHITACMDGYVAKVSNCPTDLHGTTLSAVWLAVGREVNRQKGEAFAAALDKTGRTSLDESHRRAAEALRGYARGEGPANPQDAISGD